jgi:hypothetical protein
MASPFSKYTGEQVPQTNILPATTEMARQTYESISGFGKDIAGALMKYQAKNEERQKNSIFAANVISQFLEAPEELTDEQDRPNAPVLSQTAPSHIRQLYKKAESEGNGDWVSGMSGVSGLELESFLELQTKYKVEEKERRQNEFQQAGLDLQRAGHTLAERKFELDKQASEVGIKTALFNLERAKATAATQDEIALLTKQKLQLEVDYEKLVGPDKARAFKLTLEGQELDLAGKRRTESKLQMMDAVTAAQVAPTKTLQYESKTNRLYGQAEIDGQVINSFDLEAELKKIDPNLKLEDVDGDGVLDPVVTGEAPAVPVATQIARGMTGDAKFEVADRAADTNSTLNNKFIQSVYDEVTRLYPSIKTQIDFEFKLNPATGGQNKDLQNRTNPAEQYAVALKWFKTPSVQAALSQKYKAVAPTSVIDRVKILYTSPYEDSVIKTETYQLNEQQIWDAKIESVKASFAKAGKPFTLDNRDVYKAVNLYGGYMPSVINGVQGFVSPKGEFMSTAQFAQLGLPSSLPETEWKAKQQIHNRFLKDYAAVAVKDANGNVSVKGGQMTDTGYRIFFLTRDPNQPINDARATDFGQTEQTITQLKKDLNKADTFVDKMTEMWGTGDFYDVVIGAWTGGKWNKEYTANQRGLETFRKYFIAPGTETEKDAERLADLMAEPSFSGWRNRETSQEILQIARSLIVDGIMIEAESKGFTVVPPNGGVDKRLSPEQRQAMAERIASLTGVTLPSQETKKK